MKTTRESTIGGLWLLWSGNPHMRLGQLVENFVGAEGFDIREIPDSEWPQRAWRFCPFCGRPDPTHCMDPDDASGCLAQMWDDGEPDA